MLFLAGSVYVRLLTSITDVAGKALEVLGQLRGFELGFRFKTCFAELTACRPAVL